MLAGRVVFVLSVLTVNITQTLHQHYLNQTKVGVYLGSTWAQMDPSARTAPQLVLLCQPRRILATEMS